MSSPVPLSANILGRQEILALLSSPRQAITSIESPPPGFEASAPGWTDSAVLPLDGQQSKKEDQKWFPPGSADQEVYPDGGGERQGGLTDWIETQTMIATDSPPGSSPAEVCTNFNGTSGASEKSHLYGKGLKENFLKCHGDYFLFLRTLS